jgi:sugar/nucleoside kinase (ribokinase family)
VSITVVGSVAFDAVKTPFGERERMLGGAATYFALAASFFDEVHVVGRVGEDFGDEDMDVVATRGTDVSNIERVAGGKTFFWAGEYGWDLNSRETLDTQLNVFEDFKPELSAASRDCDVLFLANIQPELQLSVLEQCREPKFVALDSMNLWIDIARDALIEVICRVDCVILNDAELRQLTERPSIVGAARALIEMGPTAVVAKLGEYGASLITEDGFFALPAYPLETVIDPTGAGDTFAGGFVGSIARQLDGPPTEAMLRQAMAYGTALASYSVEEFGTERMERLTAGEIDTRVEDLRRITQFEHVPAPLQTS